MARLDGKVAFITGAARGIGRAYAVRLAREGADVIAADLSRGPAGEDDGPAAQDGLAETSRLVEALGRRIITAQVDVRDLGGLERVLGEAVATLGRLDIVCANAGIGGAYHPVEAIPEVEWSAMLDINLSGAWKTVRAAVPHLDAGGRGGSVVITNSAAGLMPYPHTAHYVSAKHGLVGLMRALALELGPRSIRVNSLHPTAVDTVMFRNDATLRLFRPDVEEPTIDDLAEAAVAMHALPMPWVEAEDGANAMLFLVSDEARCITGVTLPVDAGACIK